MSILPRRPTCINTNASRAPVMTKSMTNQPRGSSPDLPKWVKPQLCKLVTAPPQGPEWLHEIKYDGYRMHARLDRGSVSLLTRTGLGTCSSRSAGASRHSIDVILDAATKLPYPPPAP